MKIRQVGAELFHADGRTYIQTDRHDGAHSRFSQFRERAYKRVRICGRCLPGSGTSVAGTKFERCSGDEYLSTFPSCSVMTEGV
jgi:hypothetical protein